jgi:hypothetical protein
MTNIESDLAALVSRHAAAARGAALLSLAETLLGDPRPQIRIASRLDLPRFINLGIDGKPTEGDHVAVYQVANDLIWTAAPIGIDLTQPDAMRASTDCTILGTDGWRGPAQIELFSILDFDFWDPCVNPKHFKGPFGFTWSSTPYKGAAGYFRGVNLNGGGSDYYRRDSHDYALAVRAGQQLGLRI